MKTYLFSPSSATAIIDEQSFPLTENNPCIIDGEFGVINFLLGNDFETAYYSPKLPSVSQNVKRYDFFNETLIIPSLKRKRDLTHKKLFSETQTYFGQEINASVICDGGIKLSLSGQYYHEEVELVEKPTEWKILPHNRLPIILIILKNKKTAIIAISLPTLKPIFQTLCDSFTLDEYLSVTSVKHDVLKHTITDIWEIGASFKHSGRKITQEKTNVSSELIPLVFLQEVAIGGDYRRFLSESLVEKAEFIPDFIGTFSHIIPPVACQRENTFSLVGKTVKYFTAKLENGKIFDFQID